MLTFTDIEYSPEYRYNIVVNATALTSGGGLSILQQFIDHVPAKGIYYIFIDSRSPVQTNSANIHLIKIDIHGWIKRFFWDARGLKIYLKAKNIVADVLISLQNTAVCYDKNAKNILYLHQAIPLHQKKWSFFKKTERKLAFYKYVYPWFIFLHANKYTKVIVQTHWMKKSLCEKFNRLESNIYVIRPDIMRVDVGSIKKIDLAPKHILFYPASGMAFKIHKEIIHALYALKNYDYDMSSIALFITIHEYDNPDLLKLIHALGLRSNVHFLGMISYDDVLVYYKSCSIVVFPSYIESFGLPLLEAAMFGKPLVVMDADYSREVISNYPQVIFAPQNSPDIWMHAILTALSQTQFNSYQPAYESNWNDFFCLIQNDF